MGTLNDGITDQEQTFLDVEVSVNMVLMEDMIREELLRQMQLQQTMPIKKGIVGLNNEQWVTLMGMLNAHKTGTNERLMGKQSQLP